MKIVLVAGARHKLYVGYLFKYTVVNIKIDLTTASLREYLISCDASIDCILIVDGGFLSNSDESISDVCSVVEDVKKKDINVVVLTHDFYLCDRLSLIGNMHILQVPFLRISKEDFHSALLHSHSTTVDCEQSKLHAVHGMSTTRNLATKAGDEVISMERKSKWRLNIGKKSKELEQKRNNYSDMSRTLNKTVAFTGRTHSGITSTLVNVAYAAAKKGMSVVILDFDIEYRTTNLYFNTFCEMAEESEDVSRSLIMTIASPNDYKDTAVSIVNNLWLAALGFDFCDERALENFFTEQKIAALVSALKNKFDFVFVDLPLNIFSRIPNTLIHFDVIGLCVENNLHSVVTTLRAFVENLNSDSIKLLNMKSKLVATKYNDESMFDDEILTPERLAELMTDDMCEHFTGSIQVAGKIPYVQNFDRQLISGILAYETSSLFMDAYDEILLRI